MSPLQDARAELCRLQADKLNLDGQLKATRPGTEGYGQLTGRLRQLGPAIEAVRARIRTLSSGGQPSLF